MTTGQIITLVLFGVTNVAAFVVSMTKMRAISERFIKTDWPMLINRLDAIETDFDVRFDRFELKMDKRLGKIDDHLAALDDSKTAIAVMRQALEDVKRRVTFIESEKP